MKARRILLMILAAVFACTLQAKNDYTDPYKDYDEAVFMDMDLDSNLSSPAVPQSCAKAVTRYMNIKATDLAKNRFTVDLLRDDEVILITIPTDEIFLPNDTLLSPSAPARLAPVLAMLGDPDMYKVVYSVHTDNTGSPFYNMQLSHRRNSSIYDYLLDHVNEALIVIPYEMGDTDPLEPNDTRDGRRANRRVELYLIPGPKMIEMAHKGILR